MSKLTAAQRAELPTKDFGLPEKARTAEAKKESGNYPMPDENHAISGMRLAELEFEKGNISAKEKEKIQRKAGRILKK